MVRRNVEVEFGYIGIQASRAGSGERESLKVNTVSPNRVGMWVLLKEGHYGRIGSGALRTRHCAVRIHRGHILRAQSLGSAGWTSRIVTAGITYDPLPQVVTGHDAGDLCTFPGSLSFIRQKKEEAILEDRSAKGRAKGVPDQLAGNIGEAILQL